MEWNRINNGLPPQEEWVLVKNFDPYREVYETRIAHWYFNREPRWYSDSGERLWGVAYWLPIPEMKGEQAI